MPKSFTIKSIDKHISGMLNKDPDLSRNSIYQAIADGTETSKDVLDAAFRGDGTVKLSREALDKIAAHLEMKDDEQEDDDCPEGQHMVDGRCVPINREPENNETKKKGKVTETLTEVFGKEDLTNSFKEVLKVIEQNSDEQTKKWIGEVVRKVFETIPAIIKAEQGETIEKYETRITELEKKLKESDKTTEEMKAKLKGKLGLSEMADRIKLQGKGLYETGKKDDRPKSSPIPELYEQFGSKVGIPFTDDD